MSGIIVHRRLKSSFLCQMLTDWAGALGSLTKISCQQRGMDVPDKAIFCGGKVTGEAAMAGRHLVDCDIWIENEQGQRTVVGKATIEFPTREAKA